MVLLWLAVRFLAILIPMYAILRVMHTVRDQQIQQDADRDLEQELAELLWVSPSEESLTSLQRKQASNGSFGAQSRNHAGLCRI